MKENKETTRREKIERKMCWWENGLGRKWPEETTFMETHARKMVQEANYPNRKGLGEIVQMGNGLIGI